MFINNKRFPLVMDDLARLFTKSNLAVLAELAKGEHSVRELAGVLGCSPAKIHQAAKLFARHGIVLAERRQNRLVLRPNRASPLYQKIQALVNTDRVLAAKPFAALAKRGAIGMYGSCARGTDDAESDLDLLIVTDEKELAIRPVLRELEAATGRRISPLVLTRRQLSSLAREDPAFAAQLQATVVALHGDPFG